MPLSGLTIIGETINDSVPSTKKLFEAGDIDGILELARSQDEKGAAYIDVNVGPRPAEFMAEMVGEDSRRDGQAAVDRHARPGDCPGRPGSLQPGPGRRQEADPQFGQRAEGGHVRPVQDSARSGRSCWFPRTWSTAARSPATPPRRPTTRRSNWSRRSWPAVPGATNDDCIIDPGIAPMGSDSEGNIHRLIGAMELIHADRSFAGCHASVGLSNFTVMLPPEAGRRLAGQGGVGKRFPDQGHAAGAGHGDRLGEAELRAIGARASRHGLPGRVSEAEGLRRADARAGVLFELDEMSCEAASGHHARQLLTPDPDP